MLKQYYENMKTSLEAGYAQRPRAFTRFNIEMADIFLEAFKPGSKTVYTSFYSFPMELMSAFDIAPFDFEIATNLMPVLDAEGSVKIMSRAEEEAYSTDLCSFHRLAMGCQLLGYMPSAELLISTSYFCDGKARLNNVMANLQGREAVTLDIPNRISRDSVVYVAEQLKTIAARLEDIAGQKLHPERLALCIRESNRARRSYLKLASIYKARPYPWNGSNAINMSIFGAMLTGRPQHARILDDIHAECLSRLSDDKKETEKYRVLWLAWYPVQPTVINRIFRDNGVAIVMGELIRVWWDEIDERNPWEGMALKCLKNPYVGPIEQRLEGIMQSVVEYGVDGVIHFSTDACRHSCAGSRLIGDALQNEGIPYTVLEGDMSDKRKYSEDRTKELLGNFIEVMAARKH